MAVFSTDLSGTVDTLLENKRYTSIMDIFRTLNAVDIAVILEDQTPQKLLVLFRLLPRSLRRMFLSKWVTIRRKC